MQNGTKILLVTPPFSQLNTPYPASPYLKGFFDKHNIASSQYDLSLEVILSIFSKKGLKKIFEIADKTLFSEDSQRIYSLRNEYINTIDIVIDFLQNKNQSMAQYIAREDFLPKGFYFTQAGDFDEEFGLIGFRDKARHICTLYLEDLCFFISESIDSDFGFSRYAERLGRYASSFDELNKKLHSPLTFIDEIMVSSLFKKIEEEKPSIVAFTVPFPGNLYSALRCGGEIKKKYPNIKVEMGGGFPNTELRSLNEIRVFDFVDYIILDDGEAPFLKLIDYIQNDCSDDSSLMRTFLLKCGKVVYRDDSLSKDVDFDDTGTPSYEGLPLESYLSVIEVANPMHKLWSDGRWNKLTFAHGCYWGKCAFCDGSLDYIGRYQPASAKTIVDRMQALIDQTKERGFHFVDEAAPPALMKEVAVEILKRGLKVTWWTNVRFEKSFTEDFCELLKTSGCIAVSGGLEVASDRLLKRINKGVTIDQVAKVASNFTKAGILVHAYLMYGFPTQTDQEVVDSLEVVRQLFENGVIQSAFWHRLAMTAHSPLGKNPEKYEAVALPCNFKGFADNDRFFEDPHGADFDKYADGLKKSLHNYMHGIGLYYELQDWFDFNIRTTEVNPRKIEKAISAKDEEILNMNKRLLWLGGVPEAQTVKTVVKKKSVERLEIVINNKTEVIDLTFPIEEGNVIMQLLNDCSVDSEKIILLSDFEHRINNCLKQPFEKYLKTENIRELFQFGLLKL
ncbi:MAG: radical SAM protein [Bacteroidales bacterium]|nr:radical SAM protein [Bacteroidales bacterium]